MRYRKTLEDNQRRNLAIANRQYLTETLLIRRLESERADAVSTMRRKIKNVKNAAILRVYDGYLKGSDDEIRKAREKAGQTYQIVEMERQELIELVKRRRIIEAHRARMERRYKEEQSHRERAEHDEIAITRYIREGGGGRDEKE